jgi:DNA polymerase-1
LAACMSTEAGLSVCAPIHDAFLIEAPLDRLDEDILLMRNIMVEASEIVLDGFACRVDAKTVKYPERYCDSAEGGMWNRVMSLLEECRDGG